MNAFDKLVSPGSSCRVFYYDGNPNNERRHIRAIVDDEQVVYRVWSRRHQTWRYYVEHLGRFELLWRDGWLTP